MASMDYYQSIFNLVSTRSVEATVGMFGITDKALREHLVKELSNRKTRFLADPVFESMFSWEKSDVTMNSLANGMLLPSLVNAMDGAKDHRFGRDWFPFRHQLKAWKTVLEDQKSMIVTSGTGSGKTECFMVPVINDLAKEYEQSQESLLGVRALFLYPLNALINSQRERLRAWTEAYDDGVRFCLYNGNTERNKHRDQGQFPHEIMTRKSMRETPAPILVTNATMLEYMLVRNDDNPIIQQSQGKLRWIVLDEAHTYVGSQAAELSLLLRRVLHAFGVESKNVRFIATSATIGDPNCETGADKLLQKYLADLAGIPIDQVVVVGGKREVPHLVNVVPKDIPLETIKKIDPDKAVSESRYQALLAHPVARKIRETIAKRNIPTSATQLSRILFGSIDEQTTLSWLDVCSQTSKPGPKSSKPEVDSEPFLPIRGHFFHQVVVGLWSCVSNSCHEKKKSSLEHSWPFGKVYTQHRQHCKCGAPVYELVFCNGCNSPYLLATESNGNLIQIAQRSVDEFSLEYENSDSEMPEQEDDEQDKNVVDSEEKVIISPIHDDYLTYPLSINEDQSTSSPGMKTFDLNILESSEELSCLCCENSGSKGLFYRRNILGTPFYISNTVPLLLDVCQESDNANERPSRGKRLITFTDSRQGTARISAKIQQDSERESIRGLAYGRVAQSIVSMPEDELVAKTKKLAEYKEKIEKFIAVEEMSLAKTIEELAENLSLELSTIGTSTPVSWNDALITLQSSQDLNQWISDYYINYIDIGLFSESGGSRNLAELVLLREFARRPKRKNSLETLGLVSVVYPALDQVKIMPKEWEKLGANLQDWKDFLTVILDFYIRENTILDIPTEWVKWMGGKIYPKTVVKYDSKENTGSKIKRWPQYHKRRNNRLIRVLQSVFDLDLKLPRDQDFANGVMRAAWDALTKDYEVSNSSVGFSEKQSILKKIPGSGVQYQLSRASMAIKVCTTAWVCPQTNRLISTTLKGITPYLPGKFERESVLCRKVTIPVCKLDSSSFTSELERKTAVRAWALKQSEITELRKDNLWTDISDGVIEGGKFIRTAEHSAQQPSSLLKRYEALFKTGKINILNCSTTMEMGVDIGGISVVAMNNVPPHPANYLQRAGRAGRRGETQAVAFTICKDNPHERGVFENPLWPFETRINAPYITLNSEQIVQRHINSVFLAEFLKTLYSGSGKEALSLSCEDFFVEKEGLESPVDQMLRWLKNFSIDERTLSPKLVKGINQVTHKSILAGNSISRIAYNTLVALDTAKEKWLPSYRGLLEEVKALERVKSSDPYRKKVEHDLRCLGQQYLLSELATRAFLPGYGFPSGIATFDHYSVSDYKSGKYVNKKTGRIDNSTRMRERPGRDLPLAIREYAPGSDVVLDGLVYRSAGILMNKFSPNEDYSQPQKITTEWRCHKCGFIGNELSSSFDQVCCSCGTNLKSDYIKEYIEPLGFAVAFISSPTNDISSQSFIPVQEPWVTAESELMPLFEPKIGSYQASSKGHIFYHSSGEFDKGYAVCLRCGRADSMDVNGQLPDTLRGAHTKLQGKLNQVDTAHCEGSDEPYAVKEGIHLGTKGQTDVFELHLKHPSENQYLQHSKSDQLPWTLAIALRQSLAELHGINIEELGFTVKASNLLECNYPVATVVLFDKAGGGAGFSSAGARHIQEMLTKVESILDCSDKCDSACQACLLGYDTRFHVDLLDRHVALKYVKEIKPYLSLPEEAKFFGKESTFCFESLGEEVISASRYGALLKVFIQQPFTEWDISNTRLKETCFHWKSLFDVVEVVLPSSDITGLDEIQKEDLRALRSYGVYLTVLKTSPDLKYDGKLLVQIIGQSQVHSIASDAEYSDVPNHNLWKTDSGYLIKSTSLNEMSTAEIDSQLLDIEVVPGDVEIEISSECNVKAFMFGKMFWDTLISKSASLEQKINSSVSLKKVSYSDCYICSPWSLMLLGESLNALKKSLGDNRCNELSIDIMTADKTANPRARGLYGEWDNKNEKITIIEKYIDGLLKVKSQAGVRDLKKMPHGRVMTLEWSDDKVITVRLDHGFGCWSISNATRPSWFDINSNADEQVKNMKLQRERLDVSFSKDFPTQVFVKMR